MPPHFAVDWTLAAAREGDDGARGWLESQADEGLRGAQTAYGQLLLEEPDRAESAVIYLGRAAQAGDAVAQFELGTLYTIGRGVALDYVSGHTWLNIAATSGHRQAAETRDVIANLMTPEQVAEAQSATREFFAAVAGPDPDAIAPNGTD